MKKLKKILEIGDEKTLKTYLKYLEDAGIILQFTKSGQSLKGDFLVDGELLFEIGEKKKSFTQIKDIKKSFLAIDNIESGFGNKIPLWLFGFLY